MPNDPKSTVDEIRARFDAEVELFSNQDTGQIATMDAALCLELVSRAASAAIPHARRALDVGCGGGNYSVRLLGRLPSVRFTLVDLSRVMLDRARSRLGAAFEAAHQGDVRELEFESSRFDVILCSAMLHHLRTPAEWEKVFAKYHRWLRPGGGLWVFDIISHEIPAVQKVMWDQYGAFLEKQGGAAYRDETFRVIEKEDTPTPVTYQLDLLRQVGFGRTDILHKNGCYAAYGALKG